jgi:glucosyl-3-phosphoglycerate synthase
VVQCLHDPHTAPMQVTGIADNLLLDAPATFAERTAIAQVDLDVREHRNRPTSELAVMSRQIMATMFSRLGIDDSAAGLTQFGSEDDPFHGVTAPVSFDDRPPMKQLVGGATQNAV